MSMGPKYKPEPNGPTLFEKISSAIQKAPKAYFSRPLYYLFYILLPVTIAAAFLNYTLNLAYLYFVAILAAIEMWRVYKENNAKR